MDNTVTVRAHFTGCNIKAGKTVMQFELDPEYKNTLPQLAMMTGGYVNLDLTSDQTVLFVDTNSGEIIDEEDDFETESFMPEEEIVDEENYPEEGPFQLPPADFYEGQHDDVA